MAIDSGGVNQGTHAASVYPGWRMERSTKINTCIYNRINTGPVGTFVGVALATVLKTTVIPHLKQYYSLACCESCVYAGLFFTVVSKQLGMENITVFYLQDYLAI